MVNLPKDSSALLRKPHNFFKRATEHACSYWLPHLENIQVVIIGGPGATKDFVKNEYFHHEIAKKIAKPHLMLDIQMKVV